MGMSCQGLTFAVTRMSLRLFGRLNDIIGFSGKIQVFVSMIFQGLSMSCILIRVVRYFKRYYGLCLICILEVHVFVCCLLWLWPCPHFCFCSHSDRDEKTTRVCVFYSQPLENIHVSFFFPEQDCTGCSCNCGVGGNLFGADTGDSLFCLNTDPLPTGSPQCETKDPRIHYYCLRFRL